MGAQTEVPRGPACGYVGRAVLQICCCLQMVMPRECRDRIMGPSPVIDESEFEGDYDVEVTRNAPSPTDVNPLLGPHIPSSTDGSSCRGHRAVAYERGATAASTAAAAAAAAVPAHRTPAATATVPAQCSSSASASAFPSTVVENRGVDGVGNPHASRSDHTDHRVRSSGGREDAPTRCLKPASLRSEMRSNKGVGSGLNENDEQQPPPSSSAQITSSQWAKKAVADLWETGRPGASHEPECVICMDPFTEDNPEMRTLCSCGENQPGCRFHYPCLLLYIERKGEKCPTCGGSLYWEEASC